MCPSLFPTVVYVNGMSWQELNMDPNNAIHGAMIVYLYFVCRIVHLGSGPSLILIQGNATWGSGATCGSLAPLKWLPVDLYII